MDTHGVPVARIVDSPQSLALHPGAGAVAGVVEALLWAETADHPRAGAVAGVVAALLWVETAGHPGAGAVAEVVAALLGVETADSDSAPFSATSPAAASFVAAAFPVAAASFVSLTALQRLRFDLQVQPAAAPGPGHLRQLARAAALLYCVAAAVPGLGLLRLYCVAAAGPLMRGQKPPGGC